MEGIPNFLIPDGVLHLNALVDRESAEYGRCRGTAIYQMLKGKVCVTSYPCVLHCTMVGKGAEKEQRNSPAVEELAEDSAIPCWTR